MTPIWAVHVGRGTPAGEFACLSGGVWDGAHLYVTGNDTTVGGTWTEDAHQHQRCPLPAVDAVGWNRRAQRDPRARSRNGSEPRRRPTGADLESANPQAVLGACSVNGASTLLACQTTDWSTGFNALLLTDAHTGSRVAELHDSGEFPGFSTPVWSDGSLIVADTDGIRAYAPGS